ncbi:hypothetical protein N5853_09785 [Bartonella sp. HY329]|uniref:hypothetical protein n=1 Tax=unclassified Bartonella TaxID=2645622 RepID=UPI0021C7F2C0|nr:MULTISPECIES: hypothetical protein [unclassified Bartonella]UXM94396.1 hypothetical protein N5853_09785 [Bartonella sp. HY329]UXN08719.1 hypothetical protein N5852_09795 [Bartonella sp. HY328]
MGCNEHRSLVFKTRLVNHIANVSWLSCPREVNLKAKKRGGPALKNRQQKLFQFILIYNKQNLVICKANNEQKIAISKSSQCLEMENLEHVIVLTINRYALSKMLAIFGWYKFRER